MNIKNSSTTNNYINTKPFQNNFKPYYSMRKRANEIAKELGVSNNEVVALINERFPELGVKSHSNTVPELHLDVVLEYVKKRLGVALPPTTIRHALPAISAKLSPPAQGSSIAPGIRMPTTRPEELAILQKIADSLARIENLLVTAISKDTSLSPASFDAKKTTENLLNSDELQDGEKMDNNPYLKDEAIIPALLTKSKDESEDAESTLTSTDKSVNISVSEVPENTQQVEKFLSSKGITVKKKTTKETADTIINSISLFLGDRYQILQPILKRIKLSMQDGRTFKIALSKYPQQTISDYCQFCQRLHDIAFLEEYRYLRSPEKVIFARATTFPKVQNFFSGQWMERFVFEKLKQAYAKIKNTGNIDDIEYLINPKVTLPNGDDFEMDIVALIAGKPLWIEVKSGDFQQHIKKYAEISKSLHMDPVYSFLVLANATDAQCLSLSSLYPLTVTNLENVEAIIIKTLDNDLDGGIPSEIGAAEKNCLTVNPHPNL